jgi:tetratricopeptide (TPR) repeat protein
MKKIKKLLETFKSWDALEIIEREIENGSENCKYYIEAAHIYRGVGEMTKAIDYYKKAKEKGCEDAEKYIKTIEKILKKI